MRKPNYGQERMQRERDKEAKARAKQQKREEARASKSGTEGQSPAEEEGHDEGAASPPKPAG